MRCCKWILRKVGGGVLLTKDLKTLSLLKRGIVVMSTRAMAWRRPSNIVFLWGVVINPVAGFYVVLYL